jgi:hypothetical protein
MKKSLLILSLSLIQMQTLNVWSAVPGTRERLQMDHKLEVCSGRCKRCRRTKF